MREDWIICVTDSPEQKTEEDFVERRLEKKESYRLCDPVSLRI